MLPTAQLLAAARAESPLAVELRRAIHRHPELAHRELETTRRIAAALDDAAIRYSKLPTGCGLVAEVGTGPGVVGFRADLDGLPIEEASGDPFASAISGVMHACGHDAHAAIAVGIARVVRSLELPGTYRFLFQPAEEHVPSGAADLIEAGALDGMGALVAFHVDPTQPPGRLGLRTGAITSASDRLRIRLEGPGGHTSRPERAIDLISIAADIVRSLPRTLEAVAAPQRLVAVFGTIRAGEAENVIPARLDLAGTVRTPDIDTWRRLPQLVERTVHELVGSSGAAAKVEYTQGTPPVVNDPVVVEAAGAAAAEILGKSAIVGTHQSMGAEDFAWYLQRVPGAMFRLGAATGDGPVDLHSAEFRIDESCIEVGIAAGAAIMMRLVDAVG